MYKRKEITIQFIQQGIIILNNNQLIEYQLNSVDNYKVINKELFIEEIQDILNILKINKNILTSNINIIIDTTYSELEKEIIENIFKELSFNKIEFINTIDIFKPKDNEIIVDISTTSIKILYKDTIIQTNIYYSKYISILNIYMKNILKNYNIKYLYLYGNHSYDKSFIDNLEKTLKIKTYIYTQPELIPIRLLI
jgi:hypothetical protein